MLDPKPFAAFIEYTLKPITEDLLSLSEYCKDNNIDLHRLSNHVFNLFVIDKVISLISSLIVTGFICLTLYLILSNSQITHF